MFQTLHEISKNLIFVFVWKYVWKYVNINVSDIKKEIEIKFKKQTNKKNWWLVRICCIKKKKKKKTSIVDVNKSSKQK